MENGGVNGNQRGGAGNARGGGRGSAQWNMAGRGGFQAPNQAFHPGYGGRGGYSGRGGGRYNRTWTAGRSGGRNNQYRGGFAGHRGGAQAAVDNHHNAGAAGAGQAGGAAAPQGGNNAANTINLPANNAGNAINLPAQAMALLQQAFASVNGLNLLHNEADQVEAPKSETDRRGSQNTKLVQIKKLSKPTSTDEVPQSSKGPAKDGNGKVSYCYKCYTKGHVMQDCTQDRYCDICDCKEHVRARCPTYLAVKQGAVLSGYAVEGLGFFHIPLPAGFKQNKDARAALIRVTEGVLTIPNIVAELQRLIPSDGWQWQVEDMGNSTFRTLFPTKMELQRMVE